ncbi:hypothetical protein GCM10010319_00530 [Streptomyces blastmyceticus]|uniref:DUF397 domain-containing protein n=1 Tax=Streptomyces blastmyceticus TaxID=68180 RepID=A0ABN0W7Y9_9ACTN
MPSRNWQKSSYSEYGSSCVHLAIGRDGAIHLYESDAPDTILTTTPNKLRPLISRIKAHTLTR